MAAWYTSSSCWTRPIDAPAPSASERCPSRIHCVLTRISVPFTVFARARCDTDVEGNEPHLIHRDGRAWIVMLQRETAERIFIIETCNRPDKEASIVHPEDRRSKEPLRSPRSGRGR